MECFSPKAKESEIEILSCLYRKKKFSLTHTHVWFLPLVITV